MTDYQGLLYVIVGRGHGRGRLTEIHMERNVRLVRCLELFGDVLPGAWSHGWYTSVTN